MSSEEENPGKEALEEMTEEELATQAVEIVAALKKKVGPKSTTKLVAAICKAVPEEAAVGEAIQLRPQCQGPELHLDSAADAAAQVLADTSAKQSDDEPHRCVSDPAPWQPGTGCLPCAAAETAEVHTRAEPSGQAGRVHRGEAVVDAGPQ